MSESSGQVKAFRCPSCGREPAEAADEEAEAEITHCEWCGAEYPMPEHGSASGATTPRPSAPPHERD
jgi:transcription elongation factor Elf1